MEKYHKLHGYPSDFQFTKTKKSVACAQVGLPSSYPHQSIVPLSQHGNHNDQYHHVLHQFDQTHLSSSLPSDDSTDAEHSGFANFPGMFNSIFNSPSIHSVGLHVCATSQLGVFSWILDSGATNHMTPHKHLLHNLQPISTPFLTLPNGYKVKVVSTGSLILRHDMILQNVLLVPSFQFNLISIFQLVN